MRESSFYCNFVTTVRCETVNDRKKFLYLNFCVGGLGFRILGFLRFKGLGFRVLGLGFRV